ncbi:hypothetical protein K461DRAFT_137329 [Myriangium duriaei CBS 260.36]|uniref:C4-dicarboxylate transporter/malic acid transporter n=1 Tax=Myriangium duriaei CBS 260.36 TaxID=1168546 RepID=A0A9P4MHJ1_9PEZI|nr:hypothetical protein K461DRAFT_137329 [Myriangium duriaei CBS 260.36]
MPAHPAPQSVGGGGGGGGGAPLQPSRTRSSRRTILLPPAGGHATLRRDYAIPTPLHSPAGSPRRGRSVASTAKGDDEAQIPTKLSWRGRVRHFTWTWFCMTMATGQVANVLAAVPFRFRGLYALGLVVMLLNIALFLFNVTMISLRFRLYPSTFWSSMTHPTESLFAPAAVISLGTILMNITQYGVEVHGVGTWLESTMIIMFWIYCGLAMASACGIYLVMWSTQTFTISRMTPVWIFPAYPLLVVAPHASILSARISSHHQAVAIIVGGFTLQGIGFMVSLMVYAAFIYRLMTNKLPAESLRPGMFISVGPSGFTVSGVIGMGQQIRRVIPSDFMGVGDIAGVVTMVAANWMGIWLWGLAIFFFIVSVGAHVNCVGSKRMSFAMTWYSFVFPNTGLTVRMPQCSARGPAFAHKLQTGTFAVGLALHSKPIQVLGCVFTILLVLTWISVFVMMIRAVHLKQILWPQKQEDREEGGWILTREEETGSLMFRSDIESVLDHPLETPMTTDVVDHERPAVTLTRASIDNEKT